MLNYAGNFWELETYQIEEIGKNGDDGAKEVKVGVSEIRRESVNLVGQEGVDFIFGRLRFPDCR